LSYYGRRDDAKKDCAAADIQLDGNDPSNTSPVLKGSQTAGMAPMSGPNTFTKERHRPEFVGNRRTGFRREFPSEGVGGK
jgi:hypothetical protein